MVQGMGNQVRPWDCKGVAQHMAGSQFMPRGLAEPQVPSVAAGQQSSASHQVCSAP